MRLLVAILITFALLAGACGVFGGGSKPASQEAPKTPEEAVERFLSLWQQKDYSALYDLLSTEAQAGIARDKFVGRYEAIADEATITGIDYRNTGVVGNHLSRPFPGMPDDDNIGITADYPGHVSNAFSLGQRSSPDIHGTDNTAAETVHGCLE